MEMVWMYATSFLIYLDAQYLTDSTSSSFMEVSSKMGSMAAWKLHGSWSRLSKTIFTKLTQKHRQISAARSVCLPILKGWRRPIAITTFSVLRKAWPRLFRGSTRRMHYVILWMQEMERNALMLSYEVSPWAQEVYTNLTDLNLQHVLSRISSMYTAEGLSSAPPRTTAMRVFSVHTEDRNASRSSKGPLSPKRWGN